MNIINNSKFEELILRNWTSFIDFKCLLAIVMKHARDSVFPVVKTKDLKVKGTQIKLSRFELISDGFAVWVEFSIPKDDQMIIGTSEFHLSNSGDVEHLQTLGNIFVRDQKNTI